MNPKNLPAGKNPPEDINVYIEIPSGGNIKYEVDEKTGALTVDRFLHTASFYPFNYGFIPQTKADDGDPLDVIVISQYPVHPGVTISCLPLGVLQMEDEAGNDEKIIAVPNKKIDPVYGAYNSISDVPQAMKKQIKHFFETYKTLEPGKWVKVTDWEGVEKAKQIIKKGLS